MVFFAPRESSSDGTGARIPKTTTDRPTDRSIVLVLVLDRSPVSFATTPHPLHRAQCVSRRAGCLPTKASLSRGPKRNGTPLALAAPRGFRTQDPRILRHECVRSRGRLITALRDPEGCTFRAEIDTRRNLRLSGARNRRMHNLIRLKVWMFHPRPTLAPRTAGAPFGTSIAGRPPEPRSLSIDA